MATNYQRGRAFEYRTRNKLLERGAVYVMRAAQSKGAADLLALWPKKERRSEGYHVSVRDNDGRLIGMGTKSDLLGHDVTPPWLVQCKRGVGRISPAERAVLLDLAERTGCVPVQALTGPNGRGVVFTDLRTKETL